MSDLRRVESWFNSGLLVRPNADTSNFVDLVRALASLCGVGGIPLSANAAKLAEAIGHHDHLVLVLVDGLGLEQLETLYDAAFLREHVAHPLQAVFLSTTATALTTLATGQWPCAHAAPGWWTYLDGRNLGIVTLPFQERNSEKPLERLGLAAEDVFPAPSIWPRFEREVLSVYPENICDSAYTRYSTGETRREGYKSISEALMLAVHTVRQARKPSFTYVYIPQLDTVCHEKGTGHGKAKKLAAALDRLISSLADELRGCARLIVTADHGHTNVPKERRFVLPASDPLATHLLAQPSGEPSVPMFHVRPGHEDAFAEEFAGRFGEHFALLTANQVEVLRLLGPDKLSPLMRRRIGTFVGLAPEPAKFYILPFDGHPQNPGVHGGLTRTEMAVPLVLI